MAKIYIKKIEECVYCPNYSYRFYSCLEADKTRMDGKSFGKHNAYEGIPNWCPLSNWDSHQGSIP
jgi:hypothetical protein